MAQVNHLNVTEVASQSAGKSTATDDANNQVMQNFVDKAEVLISTTSPVVVTEAEYTRARTIELNNDTTPPTGAFTVRFDARTSPDRHAGEKRIVNNTSFTATLEVNGQSSTKPTLGGSTAGNFELYADEILEGAGGGGGGGGEANTMSSAGGDESLVNAKSGVDLPIKGLTAGSNITLTGGANDITIAASGGGGGSAIILDLGDDAGNDSTDLAEIATTGDTNSIFTEPAADKLLIDVGQNWPTADSVDINGMSVVASPDGAADYMAIYDASGAVVGKILLEDFPGLGGGGGGGTGAVDFLGKLTFSSDASLTFDLSDLGTDEILQIYLDDITLDVNDAVILMRAAPSGTPDSSSIYEYTDQASELTTHTIGGGTTTGFLASSNQTAREIGNPTNQYATARITMYGMRDSSRWVTCMAEYSYQGQAGSAIKGQATTVYEATSDVDQLQILASGGASTIETGSAYFYRWKVATSAASEVNDQTGTSYTLAITDVDDIVTMDNASANTVTIPTNASVEFPIGTSVHILQKGAGATTVDADTGVNLNGVSSGGAAISARWDEVTIKKIGTNDWIIRGDHGAVA